MRHRRRRRRCGRGSHARAARARGVQHERRSKRLAAVRAPLDARVLGQHEIAQFGRHARTLFGRGRGGGGSERSGRRSSAATARAARASVHLVAIGVVTGRGGLCCRLGSQFRLQAARAAGLASRLLLERLQPRLLAVRRTLGTLLGDARLGERMGRQRADEERGGGLTMRRGWGRE